MSDFGPASLILLSFIGGVGSLTGFFAVSQILCRLRHDDCPAGRPHG